MMVLRVILGGFYASIVVLQQRISASRSLSPSAAAAGFAPPGRARLGSMRLVGPGGACYTSCSARAALTARRVSSSIQPYRRFGFEPTQWNIEAIRRPSSTITLTASCVRNRLLVSPAARHPHELRSSWSVRNNRDRHRVGGGMFRVSRHLRPPFLGHDVVFAGSRCCLYVLSAPDLRHHWMMRIAYVSNYIPSECVARLRPVSRRSAGGGGGRRKGGAHPKEPSLGSAPSLRRIVTRFAQARPHRRLGSVSSR